MSLIKRSPSKEMELWNSTFPIPRAIDRLQREMNRAFDGLFRGDLFDADTFMNRSWSPAVDISETNDSYLIRAELPGLKKDEVKITIENNTIAIRGEKKNDTEKKGENFHVVERSYGSFERTFTLPGAIKNDSVEARFEDGILSVTLPKTEASKQNVIDVKVR